MDHCCLWDQRKRGIHKPPLDPLLQPTNVGANPVLDPQLHGNCIIFFLERPQRHCWGLHRGDLGLKCLRTSWKRDGGGEKRWDGGKETLDVKHHLLEPDFDLSPVGGEREGEVWAGGRWARQDGMSRDLGLCLPWLLFPDPQLPHCKTRNSSSGFTPCTCPIFQGKYFCFMFTAAAFSPFMPHFFVAACCLAGQGRLSHASVAGHWGMVSQAAFGPGTGFC